MSNSPLPSPLLHASSIAGSPAEFVQACGDVFATFDERIQDSGNVSFGVQVGGERFFVKTAGEQLAGARVPYEERVQSLLNAERLGRMSVDRF